MARGSLIFYDNDCAIREHLALAELSDVSIESVGARELDMPVERAAMTVSEWPRLPAIITGVPLGRVGRSLRAGPLQSALGDCGFRGRNANRKPINSGKASRPPS